MNQEKLEKLEVLFAAVGGIDERYIEDADATKKKQKAHIPAFAPWQKRAAAVAACLVVLIGGFLAYRAPFGGGEAGDTDYTGAPDIPPLRIEEGVTSFACYPEPDDWRGLPAENFVLQEQGEGQTAADRAVFETLQDLAAAADAFIVVPYVHQIAADGDAMQAAVAEYTETIGDRIETRQWDDYTISTGSRILIRQTRIGGCTPDEPSHLLRAGGVYLLPIKFDADLGAYRVVGDLDVLFELDSEGKIVSHSRFPALNRYDGKAFSELINAVRALYPLPETAFSEQAIASLEEAERQVNSAYLNFGFRKFSAVFEKESVIEGAEVYLFQVTFGENGNNGSEYGVIAKTNGAFIRGVIDKNGAFQTYGGLGAFPRERK